MTDAELSFRILSRGEDVTDRVRSFTITRHQARPIIHADPPIRTDDLEIWVTYKGETCLKYAGPVTHG